MDTAHNPVVAEAAGVLVVHAAALRSAWNLARPQAASPYCIESATLLRNNPLLEYLSSVRTNDVASVCHDQFTRREVLPGVVCFPKRIRGEYRPSGSGFAPERQMHLTVRKLAKLVTRRL